VSEANAAGRAGPPLRIAVLGDLEGAHTRRWLRFFAERGHEVHAVSFYQPSAPIDGVEIHVLSPEGASATNRGHGGLRALGRRLPRWAQRLIQARRYQRAGLGDVLAAVRPHVFHAHYVVEHGFYGAFAGFRPYVVSAWGSDLFREAAGLPGRLFARRAFAAADLVTANDPALAQRAVALGAEASRTVVVRLGIDRLFLEGPSPANLGPRDVGPPAIVSDRALEPLYNVDVVLRAFARLRQRLPVARLLVANDGSQRRRLEALAAHLALGGSVEFSGRLPPQALRDRLAGAHVYVSVPSSDSLSLSTLEAMAAGAFPVVSDLPSQCDWIGDRVNGLLVPPRDAEALAVALATALADDGLRRAAVEPNRRRVAEEGLTEKTLLAMEAHYYRLGGLRGAEL
jgi:glycosyltransferase involved in cell wall biosynthesis